MLSRNRFCLLDGKIRDKSPDNLFDLIFWQYVPYNCLSSVCSEFFDLSCRSAPKTILFSAVLFFSAFVPVFLLAVLQTLSLLFLCKNFWAGKRNSSPSWKYLFAVEENYFNRVLTSLIGL